ncbi:hypothetical protein [Aureibacter tunicatorum]|uniref:Uncharacterized protein n=1 Tax=Aureibacter tunicatorum TaxID=866807 RepID=A0AAE4BUN0_9BACT|nr:hypothetical protein [Aureibacter tunicatorum]MDR6240943.1 hypothetical protein [Aureibacter tunicatorum]BDD03723.1 hypothetical protein AUTU_12060 [Aureibacter tunicatorum]
MNFSIIYALIFGLVSAIAGLLFITETYGKGWEYLWLSTGFAGFFSAFLFSKLHNKHIYAGFELVKLGLVVGITSHWVHWYISLLVSYINVEFLGAYMYGEHIDPFEGLLVAFELSFISLLVFGWIAIPISIGVAFLTRWIIYRKGLKSIE